MVHDGLGNEMCVMEINQTPGKTIYVECNGVVHTSTFRAPRGSKVRAWVEYPDGRRAKVRLTPTNEGRIQLDEVSSLVGLDGRHLRMKSATIQDSLKKEEPKKEEVKREPKPTDIDEHFKGDKILPVQELPDIL